MGVAGEIGSHEWRQWWDIDNTVSFCLGRGLTKVALQFPDDLLSEAPEVTRHVQEAIAIAAAANSSAEPNSSEQDTTPPCRVYMLADTSYNPTCVDEVAAAHIKAEAVVHYGPACMCRLSRLPACYIFGRQPLDVQAAAGRIATYASGLRSEAGQIEALVVFLEHSLNHHRASLQEMVEGAHADKRGVAVVISDVVGYEAEPSGSSGPSPASNENGAADFQMAGLRVVLPAGFSATSCAALWVGNPGSSTAAHLQMSLSQNSWSTLVVNADGTTEEVSEGLPTEVSRLLRRRYFLVEKAREAAIVGLLVGTLGVAGYSAAIALMRRMIEQAGKRCYTFLVGKPSPAKLANFPEIEVFVMIGCPQGLVLDSKEYYAPVITPHEASVAFTDTAWDPSNYRLGFNHLLEESPVSDEVVVALEAGGSPGASSGQDSLAVIDSKQFSELSVQLKTSGQLQVTSAAEYLTYRRTYAGLETPATGAHPKPVEKAVPGRSGRAATYKDEPSASS